MENHSIEEDFFHPEADHQPKELEIVDDRKIQLAEKNAKLDLINLVRSSISSLRAKNDIMTLLETAGARELLRRLETDSESVTSGSIIKMMEVIQKGKNEEKRDLFNLFNKQNQANQQLPLPPGGQQGSGGNDSEKEVNPESREEIKMSKNVLGYLEKLHRLDKEGKLEVKEENEE